MNEPFDVPIPSHLRSVPEPPSYLNAVDERLNAIRAKQQATLEALRDLDARLFGGAGQAGGDEKASTMPSSTLGRIQRLADLADDDASSILTAIQTLNRAL